MADIGWSRVPDQGLNLGPADWQSVSPSRCGASGWPTSNRRPVTASISKKSNAPMRARPRKSRHRRKSRSVEFGDRALDVGDARRDVVQVDVFAHDAPGEVRIGAGILQRSICRFAAWNSAARKLASGRFLIRVGSPNKARSFSIA